MESLPTAAPIVRLIEELHKLPGVGSKTAQRLAFYLIRTSKDDAIALADAIAAVKEQIVFCSVCENITDTNPCAICTDESRDRTQLCVVEQPLDILALERTRSYKGRYHVLHGAISPINGVGPNDLKLKELLARLQREGTEELILATNPNLEGEATATYIQRHVATLKGLRVTRLARGLPSGADLEYADEVTLSRALEGRQQVL
ncbi:MAG: recombination protein RecR [Chloroflexi bacterium]|nr:recombination protein RecR [Chloroflexota bacterium]